jgi:hypothetical protein
MLKRLILISPLLILTACDIPGLGPDAKTVQREADSKAIGGACRFALRGIEDCYTLNPKAAKAAVFDGWKEMDQYMRENKVEGAPSVVPIPVGAPPTAENKDADTENTEEPKGKKSKADKR